MHYHYINFEFHHADGFWARRQFVHSWGRIYAGDPRWSPPATRTLQSLLAPGHSPYLARSNPLLAHLSAYRQRVIHARDARSGGFGASVSMVDEPVSATILLSDPRRVDRSAYLSLLHCVNDEEVLERLLYALAEAAAAHGARRLIGPTGLSPWLGSGLLLNAFNVTPPLHTAYNPPYMPDLLATMFQPCAEQRLYHVAVPAAGDANPGSLPIQDCSLADLAGTLFPLLQQACDDSAGFPLPDQLEAEFLHQLIGQLPATVRVASHDSEPVGFVVLQPDYGEVLRRARGGRNPLRAAWRHWRVRRPVDAGRVLFGAVTPAWRGRGVGRQLWHDAMQIARQSGWSAVTIGPFDPASPAAAFVRHQGARPMQQYTLYELGL